MCLCACAGREGSRGARPNFQTAFLAPSPSPQVGRIIGKAGVTIRELEGRTGVRVQVDHKAESELKPVHLIGNASGVEVCKGLVNDVLNSETGSLPSGGVESTRQVQCPPGIVGRIIGRGGETIRSLQSGSGAHILVDQVGCVVFVCVCVCVCVCVHACACACMRVCGVLDRTRACVYVSVCVYACVHICECKCARICVHACFYGCHDCFSLYLLIFPAKLPSSAEPPEQSRSASARECQVQN